MKRLQMNCIKSEQIHSIFSFKKYSSLHIANSFHFKVVFLLTCVIRHFLLEDLYMPAEIKKHMLLCKGVT